MRVVVGMLLCTAAAGAGAQVPDPCAASTVGQAQSAALEARLAPEFVAPAYRLGAPSGVLEQAFDEVVSVDEVLTRMRLEACMLAKATPPATPGLPAGSVDPATYKPKTEFDNTPWRFDMNQNGKRMTADEFSAWMKARGVRVARGAAPTAPAAEPADPADPAADPAPVEPRGD
jgi:hypothetical protein